MVSGECETILNSSGEIFLPPPRFSKALQPPSARLHSVALNTRKVAGFSLVRRIVCPSGSRFCPLIMAASGRALFLADERIDEHQRDANDDRRIGDVEGRPMPMTYMEIGEIEHRSPTGTVDNIADSAAHDKADAPACEYPVGSSQPHEQPDADRDRDRREDPGGQGAVAAQQTEAHAAVPHDHQPEEALDHRHDGARLHQIAQQELLGRLVGHQGRDDQDHRLALDRPHELTASSQRRQSSGWPADLPTSSRTCQQRAHLLPWAGSGSTATPATSGRVKAPVGPLSWPLPSSSSPSEVMKISQRSSPSNAFRYSGAAWTRGAACRLEPMRFSARSSSRAPVTTRRSARTILHFSPSAASSQAAGISG